MTATAPEPTEQPTGGQSHRTMYWIIGIVVVLLCIIGLITYSGKKADAEAKDKAQQLTQAFEQAGLRVPQDQTIITRSLGTDGGAICENPGDALGKAILFDSLANGASFVGRRPIVADRRIVAGQALIMQVYCPDKLQDYRDVIDDLKFDDTLRP